MPSVTTITLARHGQTIWHKENRYTGSSDIELDDVGYRQAAALGAWAPSQGFTALYRTDLQRTADTIAPVENATGLIASVESRLRELNFGIAEGVTMSEMREQRREVVTAFEEDPCESHWPQGEHPRDAATRARAAIQDIASKNPQGHVFVVAHNTLIRLLVCDIMSTPLRDYRRRLPVMNPTSATRLQVKSSGEIGIIFYNLDVTGVQ